MKIQIIGYEQNGQCEHCGRALKHCIKISDGRVVGATCFDKKITKPRIYNGKSYRVGSEQIVQYAKIAQFSNLARHGLTSQHLTFDAA